MNIKKYWMMLAIALVSLCIVSCGGDDDEEEDSIENPISANDPEGTIVANLTNDGKELLIIDLRDNNVEGVIFMNSANNLCSINVNSVKQIVCVGSVEGISSITRVPENGWAHESAVIPGYGYIFRFQYVVDYDDSGNYIYNYRYARLYVVDYMESTSGGIMGCTIKYQLWEPNNK